MDLCLGKVCAPPATPCLEEGVCRNGECRYAFKAINTTCDDGNDRTVRGSGLPPGLGGWNPDHCCCAGLQEGDQCDGFETCAGVDACVAENVVCPVAGDECTEPSVCFRGVCSPLVSLPDNSSCIGMIDVPELKSAKLREMVWVGEKRAARWL